MAETSARLEKANTELAEVNASLTQLKSDTTHMGEVLRSTAQKLEGLNHEYDQLNAYYKNLLNSSGKLNRDFTIQKEQLLAIQDNLERTRKLNDSLSLGLAERERKVKELEQVLANKDKAVRERWSPGELPERPIKPAKPDPNETGTSTTVRAGCAPQCAMCAATRASTSRQAWLAG